MRLRRMIASSATAGLVAAVLLLGWQVHAETNRVRFPENLDKLVHYTTVRRGNVEEHARHGRAWCEESLGGAAACATWTVIMMPMAAA